MVVDGLDLCLVQPVDILGDIFLIVFQQLPLYAQGATEILVLDVGVDHLGHAAYRDIVAEKTEEDIHLQIADGLDLKHVLVQVVYEFLGIALGPQKFLKIHGVHLVIFLVAHAVGLYLAVVDTHQRARADDVEAAVELEELQRGGTVGACLQFVKEE